jgi:hypothetical protein
MGTKFPDGYWQITIKNGITKWPAINCKNIMLNVLKMSRCSTTQRTSQVTFESNYQNTGHSHLMCPIRIGNTWCDVIGLGWLDGPQVK